MELKIPDPVIKGAGTVMRNGQVVGVDQAAQSASPDSDILAPKVSDKKPFDDSPVPGLVDHEIEGGAAPVKSTGDGYGEGVPIGGSFFEQQEDDNQYSLMGFKVSMKRDDGTVVGCDIRMNFKDKKDAMACVNGTKFVVKTPDGKTAVGEIISGMPIICFGGAQGYQYIREDNSSFWRRG